MGSNFDIFLGYNHSNFAGESHETNKSYYDHDKGRSGLRFSLNGMRQFYPRLYVEADVFCETRGQVYELDFRTIFGSEFKLVDKYQLTYLGASLNLPVRVLGKDDYSAFIVPGFVFSEAVWGRLKKDYKSINLSDNTSLENEIENLPPLRDLDLIKEEEGDYLDLGFKLGFMARFKKALIRIEYYHGFTSISERELFNRGLSASFGFALNNTYEY